MQHPQQPQSPIPPAAHQLARGESLATTTGAHIMNDEGQVTADVPLITAVGLCNLCEIHSHEIVRVAGLVSHFVRFMDGGQMRFAYNARGELVELYSRGVSAVITQDGRVMAAMAGSPVLQEFAR